MAVIPYLQVRKGMVLVEEGQLQFVVERDPHTWRADLQLKLKNLATGNVITRRVRPDDQAEEARLEKRAMQYIYQDGDGYVFMDADGDEQVTVAPESVGGQSLYLTEGCAAEVMLHEGKPIALELPTQVELTVTDTVPGNTRSQRKSALLETGLKVNVPASVDVGEAVLVDTRTGEYLSRVENRVGQ